MLPAAAAAYFSISLSVISFTGSSFAADPLLSLVDALLTAVESLLPSAAIFFLSIYEKKQHITTITIIRAITTPEAVAACSLVISVPATVNAV